MHAGISKKRKGLRIADFNEPKGFSIRNPKSEIRKGLYENAQVTRFAVDPRGLCGGSGTCQRSRGHLRRCGESGIRAKSPPKGSRYGARSLSLTDIAGT